MAKEVTRRQVEQLTDFLRRQTVLLEPLEHIQEARHERLSKDTGSTHAWCPEQTTNNPGNSRSAKRRQMTHSRHMC